MHLKSLLKNSALRYGDRNAIQYGDRRLTYSDTEHKSNMFAGALIKAGIIREDRVALFLSNSPEFVISFFGSIKAGAIAVPLDQQYKATEIRAILKHAQPSVIVAEASALDVICPLLPEFGCVKAVIAVSDEACDGAIDFDSFLSDGSAEEIAFEPLPDDVAVLMYTSFASLKPRGVMLTHDSFVKEAEMSARGYRQTQQDVMMLFALPMFHVFGLVSAVLGSVYSGSTIVVIPGTGLSIGSFMAAIEREKGTMYLGVPFIYSLAVDLAEKGGLTYNLDSMRIWASAGAPLSPSLAERFRKGYGREILDCYGLTEAVSHVTCPDLDLPVVPGSAGRALPGWKVKITDDAGHEVPAGTAGEILIEGPVMKGYYKDPTATGQVLKNGWLRTGDLGRIDESGNLYITGRSKPTIIIKGQNIYPEDPESVIASHPGVKEAAVMGIGDRVRGEVIAAAVSVREGCRVTEAEIRQLCGDTLAGYKVPRKILFIDSLPRKKNGDIDKETLRRELSLPPVFPVP
jgi:long-chain acyl-CoA synthetase